MKISTISWRIGIRIFHDPIQWMSDGLAANTPKQHQDQTLDINCIVHGRRKLVELEDYFPNESAQVIDAIAKVYKHETECKKQQLTPDQRLAYHQQHSRAVMDDLKAWMEKQFEDRCVEPNSRLGGAFDYLLKRWKSLTRFLEVPGAPLDNNTAERALKMILRLRKNSLFYANPHGAYVADILTSLIETCRLARINPLDYLTALMHNRSAVFRDPGCLVAMELPGPSRWRIGNPPITPPAASPRPTRPPRGCHSTVGSAVHAPRDFGSPAGLRATTSVAPVTGASGTARIPDRHSITASARSPGGCERQRSPHQKGSSPSRCRHSALSPSIPRRKSAGSRARKTRL